MLLWMVIVDVLYSIGNSNKLFPIRGAWRPFQYENAFWPGSRLNIKTVLSTYGDFHVKDKTSVRTSYL